MRIACLGWGSLIWDPRDLPIVPAWHDDGPLIGIEFTRMSHDGRITLVIQEGAAPIRVYWALMQKMELAAAREALRRREGNAADRHIGSWSVGAPVPPGISDLAEFAARHKLDHVIWTALPAQFHGVVGDVPSVERVIAYLQGLKGELAFLTERYIRRAPAQTDTLYRRRIADALGWRISDTWPD
ncbi:hypothetical protein [Rhizobium halophytocola]|uniref:Uncharacterized protein n=1 Tax=Rhizobium halophytocola TaxID=735519 RepID=A0ABS4DSU7_9HYPH|nr:hypothetical protein [Rhizobium halophytocola]MBP1848773.1 hypothetical protein [Rhizobium halophytocola]